jgi:hypothetical protein
MYTLLCKHSRILLGQGTKRARNTHVSVGSFASLCQYPADVRFPPNSVWLPWSDAPRRLLICATHTPQSERLILIQFRPDVRRDGMTATGEVDTLFRRHLLKFYGAPHLIVYFFGFNLHIAPKLVAVSAVIEINVANPQDCGTNY